MPKKRKHSKKDHRGLHHIIPSSHGGPNEPWNLFSGIANDPFWQPHEQNSKHPAWHILFFNYLPSDVIALLKNWTSTRGKLRRSKLSQKQRRAWDTLFGHYTTPEKALAWVEKNFLPAEKKWKRIMRRKTGHN